MIAADPEFQVISRSLALVVFRLWKPQWTGLEANLHNQRLHDRLAARHDVFLTQTSLHSDGQDIFCMRIALGGQFTTIKDVKGVWEIVKVVAAETV
jgi:aromatic-L-amino-acid decarboxylase